MQNANQPNFHMNPQSTDNFTEPSWVHGATIAGNTAERLFFDMTAQTAINVTAGNKYTFYATATRLFTDDAAMMSLANNHLIAAFSAT